MGLRETFGLRGPPPRLSAEDREQLRERRAEYWSWVGRVAIGVFLGMCAFAVLAVVVFQVWLDSVLD